MTEPTTSEIIAGLTREVVQLTSEVSGRKSDIAGSVTIAESVADRVDAKVEQVKDVYDDFTALGFGSFEDLTDRAETIASGPEHYTFVATAGQTVFHLDPPAATKPLVFVNGITVENFRLSSDGGYISFLSPLVATDSVYVYASSVVGSQMAAVDQIIDAEDRAENGAIKAEMAMALEQFTFTTVEGLSIYHVDDRWEPIYIVDGAWIEGPDGVSLIEGEDYVATEEGYIKLLETPEAGLRYVVKQMPRFSGGSSAEATLEALQRAQTAATEVSGAVTVAETNAQLAATYATRAEGYEGVAEGIDFDRIEAAADAAETARDDAVASRDAAAAAAADAIAAKDATLIARDSAMDIINGLGEETGYDVSMNIAGDIMYPTEHYPLPAQLFDTGQRILSGTSERAIVSYNSSLMAYFPATEVVFWTGGTLNPELGNVFSDTAGNEVVEDATERAWRVNGIGESGYMVSPSNPPTLKCVPRGGRRNLVPTSETLADWTPTNVTVEVSEGVSPNPRTTINAVKETSASGEHCLTFDVNSISGAGTVFTIYAKSADRGIAISIGSTTATINLQTGTIVSNGGFSGGSVDEIGDGWYKITATTTSAPSNSIKVAMMDGSNSSWTGSDKILYICSPQIEKADQPSAYQKVFSDNKITEEGSFDVWYMDSTNAISPMNTPLPSGRYVVGNVSKDGTITYGEVSGGTQRNIMLAPDVADVIVHTGTSIPANRIQKLEAYWKERYGVPQPKRISFGLDPTKRVFASGNYAEQTVISEGDNVSLLEVLSKVEADDSVVLGSLWTNNGDGTYTKTQTTTSSSTTTSEIASSVFRNANSFGGDIMEISIDVLERSAGQLSIRCMRGTIVSGFGATGTSLGSSKFTTILSDNGTKGVYIAANDFVGKIRVSYRRLGSGAYVATSATRPLFTRVPIGGKRGLVANTTLTRSGTMTVAAAPEQDFWDLTFPAAQTSPRVRLGLFAAKLSTRYTSSVHIDTSAYAFTNTNIQFRIGVEGGTGYAITVFNIPVLGEAPVIVENRVQNNGYTVPTSTVTHVSGSIWRLSMSTTVSPVSTTNMTSYIWSMQATGSPDVTLRVGKFQLEAGNEATPYQRVIDDYTVTEEGAPQVPALTKTGFNTFPLKFPAGGTYEIAYVPVGGPITYQTFVSTTSNFFDVIQNYATADIIATEGSFTPEQKERLEAEWAELLP